MPLLPLYTMYWKNVDGADMRIFITDRQGADPVAQEYYEVPLKPAHDPLITRYINSGESIYNPILGRSATIQFLNSGNTFLSTFSSGEDDRFYVNVSAGHGFIFEGFLVMEDNAEPYLPKGQIVTLTATDNLGLLKNIELTKIDGTKFRNENTIIDYVAACLYSTRLNANINVVQNLFENAQYNRNTDLNKCAWNQTFVNALTFEKDINEAEDKYTVLSKILSSWKCRLSYYSSEWWIIALTEYKNPVQYYTKYDYEGNVLAGASISANLLKTIDHASRADKFFINKSTLVRMQRPRKSEKETFNYAYAKEIICNIDFERGDVIDDTDPLIKTYEIDCWTVINSTVDQEVDTWNNLVAPTLDARIIRKFNSFDVEVERYLQTDAPFSGNHLLISEPIPVKAGDRFNFSIDVRLEEHVSTNPHDLEAYVVVKGDDGKYYKWSEFTAVSIPEDDLVWRTLSINADEVDYVVWTGSTPTGSTNRIIPVNGELTIQLPFDQNGSNPDKNANFSNLRFEHFTYINGTYKKYSGEHHKITQPGNYSAISENELFLNDSPHRLFKGAMTHYYGGAAYQLTSLWDDWSYRFQGGASWLTFQRFAKWQAYNVWNQFKAPKRIFDVNLKGLDSNSVYYCDIIHKYRNNVISDHNQNKFFVFLHLEQNWRTCQWTGTMIEIDDTTEERNFTDDFEFKYLTR